MNYTSIVTSMPINDLVGDYYEAMLLFLEEEKVGTDSIIVCEAQWTDELFTVHSQKGCSTTRDNKDPSISSITPGEYSFEQLLFTPATKEELLPLCMKFVSKELHQKSSTFYIRLYKEKRFEIVVQFFLPKASQ